MLYLLKQRTLWCMWLLLVMCGGIGATGCGERPPEAPEIVVTGADTLTHSMEFTMLGGSLLSKVELRDKTQPGENTVMKKAFTKLASLLESCLKTTVVSKRTKESFSLAFINGGCRIPLTSVGLEGSMVGSLTIEADGTRVLRANFENFHVMSLYLNGALELRASKDRYAYVIKDLVAKYADREIKMSGQGVFTRSADHTTVTFSGNGTFTMDGTGFRFEAKELKRSFVNDCYPGSGTLTLTPIVDLPLVGQVPITFEYNSNFFGGLDSGDSGRVFVTFKGYRYEKELPRRKACLGL